MNSKNHQQPDIEEDEVDDEEAIRQALEDIAKGDRGVPFEEFDREFRKQHNLPLKK